MNSSTQEPKYIQEALDDIDLGAVPARIESGMPVPLAILGLLGAVAAVLLIAGTAFLVYGERSLVMAGIQVNPVGLTLTALGLAFTVTVVVLAIKSVMELVELIH